MLVLVCRGALRCGVVLTSPHSWVSLFPVSMLTF